MRIAFIDLLEPLFEDPFQDIYGSHSSVNEKEEVEVVNHAVDAYASVHDGEVDETGYCEDHCLFPPISQRPQANFYSYCFTSIPFFHYPRK